MGLHVVQAWDQRSRSAVRSAVWHSTLPRSANCCPVLKLSQVRAVCWRREGRPASVFATLVDLDDRPFVGQFGSSKARDGRPTVLAGGRAGCCGRQEPALEPAAIRGTGLSGLESAPDLLGGRSACPTRAGRRWQCDLHRRARAHLCEAADRLRPSVPAHRHRWCAATSDTPVQAVAAARPCTAAEHCRAAASVHAAGGPDSFQRGGPCS